jgi:plastocyanin
MIVPPEEKIQRHFRIRKGLLLLACVPLICITAHAQSKSKYVCGEPQPAALCTPENTCGSASAPCTVNVTKSGNSSNVKPGIPNAKNNQFFCIAAGTTVVWKTPNKNTGFVVFFGADSPFDPDDPITGGGNKQITVKANTPGCYKYDAGAFFSGAIYGMSGASRRELVILP